jgi:hypothetical protein
LGRPRVVAERGLSSIAVKRKRGVLVEIKKKKNDGSNEPPSSAK